MTKREKGITLIALVITIIVLIILAAVSLATLTGDNGIITNARWSSFATELQEVSEKVNLAATNKAMDIYLNDEQIEGNIYATLFTEKYDSSKLSSTLKNEVETLTGSTDYDLYIVDLDKVKKDTYLYEPTIKVVFKIEGINIYGTTIHSVEYKNKIDGTGTSNSSKVASMEPNYTNGYYEPNLDGFDSENTYIIYYSDDYTSTKEITVEEYLAQGRPQTLDDGAYTFYNYTNIANSSTWGNVKTYANGQEAWWVWVPRYAYDTTTISSSTGFDIKFITLQDKILDLDGNLIGTVGEGDFANYIAHTGFTEKYTDSEGNVQIVKQLTGIWMSKYEPSTTTSFENTQETACYAPNLEGYDINNTYIVTYDKDGTEEKGRYLLADILSSGYKVTEAGSLISGTVNTSEIPSDEVWYDYGNQIWGNVVTTANGQEAWWVWIPRYAYAEEGSVTGFSVVFVDVNDNAMDGSEIYDELEKYEVHPGFNIEEDDGTVTKLKGIWMSKYEPSTTTSFENTQETACYAPDLEGFDINNTYIVTYDKDGTEVKNEYLLKNILKSGYSASESESGALISGEVDLTKIPDDEVWYDYGNQIWGNVKTYANNLEAWWVWIPRYSYCLEGSTTGFGVIFVNLDDKPFNGQENDPLGLYQVHPGFNLKDGTKLKGIWFSKYEPSGEPTTEERATPSITTE